jgi:hypothetical protein
MVGLRPDDVFRPVYRLRGQALVQLYRAIAVSHRNAEYLRSLSDRDAELARARANWAEIAAEIKNFRGSDRLGREELHERAVR